MRFEAAFAYLKRGHAIRVPEWGGYWKWDDENKTVLMHTRSGRVVDIRRSVDMDYTFSFTFRDDWEIVKNVATTEHAEKANG